MHVSLTCTGKTHYARVSSLYYKSRDNPVTDTRTILVTGVGAPGTRGTLYALKHNGEDLKLKFVGTDLKQDAVGRFFVDSFHAVQAPENGSAYIDEINSICTKEGVDVIVPQTTRETAVF